MDDDDKKDVEQGEMRMRLEEKVYNLIRKADFDLVGENPFKTSLQEEKLVAHVDESTVLLCRDKIDKANFLKYEWFSLGALIIISIIFAFFYLKLTNIVLLITCISIIFIVTIRLVAEYAVVEKNYKEVLTKLLENE